jgi:hypothetical protein
MIERRLLIEVIKILPGYSGAGDWSRVQRVLSECAICLGDDMPLTANQKIALGLPMARISMTDSRKE